MKTDTSHSKISLAECKKILSADSIVYTDEEIIQMRDWLYHMADIAIDANEMEEDKRMLEAKQREAKETSAHKI